MNSPCIRQHIVQGAFFLECVSSDGRIYGFPYSYLIHYRLEPNPALARSSNAPPERLALQFSSHEVFIIGRHLDTICDLFRKAAGFTVNPLDARYENLHPTECFVSEVSVTYIERG